MIGTRVDGKYELSKVLGQGAMGIVYRARHATTGREVALKLLHPGKALAPQALERFQREARAMGTVADSLHAVQVLDAGVDPTTGSPYIVMELLSGEDIDALLSRLGPLPIPLALRIVAQALTGLIPAHDKGIVHRDLKPSNLFLMTRAEAEPVVKVLDFGIAKMRAEGDANGGQGQIKGDLTATNSTLGSPAYMSPEQVRGAKTLDARSDLWSMGVVLYQLVSGALPFEANALSAMLLAIMNGVPVPLGTRAPWSPPEVAGIIERAMRRDLGQRFASAREMRDEIIRLLGGAPGSSVTATAAITEAMVVGLSIADRSSRPSMAGIASSVPGSGAAAQVGLELAGATAPMASLPGSAAPPTSVASSASPASNVGLLAPTQRLSTPPASMIAPSTAAPFVLPTQQSAGARHSAEASGKRTTLIIVGLVTMLGLVIAAIAIVSQSIGAEASSDVAEPTRGTTPPPSPDAGTGSMPPGVRHQGPADAPDGGPGSGIAAPNSVGSPPGTAAPTKSAKTPYIVAPASSKTNADPFKGTRTGR